MKVKAALALSVLSLATASAWAEGGPKRLDADLRGYNEPPAVSTPASGDFDARIDNDRQEISWKLTYGGFETGVTVTQAHIHLGQRNVNGGIAVFLCSNLGNGPAGTQACPQAGTIEGIIRPADVIGPAGQGLAAGEFAELVAAIRAGVTYVNVHTSARPGGEIRDQIHTDRGRHN